MVCGSCVENLKRRLKRHFGLSDEEAYRRARKGIERYEDREKPTILSGKGNPSDYSQSCSVSGSCICTDIDCITSSYPTCPGSCVSSNTCGCSCPSPLPNSQYVSDDCVSGNNCTCQCRKNIPLRLCLCIAYGSCSCSGACYYDCDDGFSWNGVACVPPIQAGLHPSKVIPLIITDFISKPLVNPILVNPPIIRLMKMSRYSERHQTRFKGNSPFFLQAGSVLTESPIPKRVCNSFEHW